MTTTTLTVAAVAHAVGAYTYTYANEVQLHDGLHAAMQQQGITATPEVHLDHGAGRIDFLIDPTGIGIEVKIAGNLDALRRQITRYAMHPRINELLVVTTRREHTHLPPVIAGKPVVVVVVGGAM